MTENNRQRDIKFITSVLEVRAGAIDLAFSMNNTGLYASAIEDDDGGVVNYLDAMIIDQEITISDLMGELSPKLPIMAQAEVMARVLYEGKILEEIAKLRDQGQANLDLINDGEMSDLPTVRRTVDLMEQLEALEEMEKASA